MRLLIVSLALAATTVHAAPWSIDVPAGYTLQPPDAAASQLERLRSAKGVLDVEATNYLAADEAVQLGVVYSRMKLGAPTRRTLEEFERGAVQGSAKAAAKHVSDAHHFEGDQLVGDAIDESETVRVHQARLYAVDTDDVVHMVVVICGGPADKLAECERAQHTIKLTLPNPAKLREGAKDIAYLLGRLTFYIVLAVFIVWGARRLSARRAARQHSPKG